MRPQRDSSKPSQAPASLTPEPRGERTTSAAPRTHLVIFCSQPAVPERVPISTTQSSSHPDTESPWLTPSPLPSGRPTSTSGNAPPRLRSCRPSSPSWRIGVRDAPQIPQKILGADGSRRVLGCQPDPREAAAHDRRGHPALHDHLDGQAGTGPMFRTRDNVADDG